MSGERPKKPLNAYFKFRTERLEHYGKDDKDRVEKCKKDWENIDPKLKTRLEE